MVLSSVFFISRNNVWNFVQSLFSTEGFITSSRNLEALLVVDNDSISALRLPVRRFLHIIVL